jgi:hypothetical protein
MFGGADEPDMGSGNVNSFPVNARPDQDAAVSIWKSIDRFLYRLKAPSTIGCNCECLAGFSGIRQAGQSKTEKQEQAQGAEKECLRNVRQPH